MLADKRRFSMLAHLVRVVCDPVEPDRQREAEREGILA